MLVVIVGCIYGTLDLVLDQWLLILVGWWFDHLTMGGGYYCLHIRVGCDGGYPVDNV